MIKISHVKATIYSKVQERGKLPPTSTFFRELINIYENNYRDEVGVKVTYHCLMFNHYKMEQ
ncbi:hypothetical protein MOF27_12445 [Priestia megaterium]|jgi:hypothetical protein|uniref:hypothetical protein n=1 Tax=Priestia megaterium TaxID=1404 RepID=UPI00227F3348|nr:hypothetical protein [Priestia megaterium]MCY9018231.1 hypothetical protein [Priestia megaterium]